MSRIFSRPSYCNRRFTMFSWWRWWWILSSILLLSFHFYSEMKKLVTNLVCGRHNVRDLEIAVEQNIVAESCTEQTRRTPNTASQRVCYDAICCVAAAARFWRCYLRRSVLVMLRVLDQLTFPGIFRHISCLAVKSYTNSNTRTASKRRQQLTRQHLYQSCPKQSKHHWSG